MDLRLVPVDAILLHAVLALRVASSQEHLIPSNAVSLAEAYVSPEAEPLALLRDGSPVGFLMLEHRVEAGEHAIWRLMIDRTWQRLGLGRAAIALAAERVRAAHGAGSLLVACRTDGPVGFYVRCGFHPTGELIGDEVVLSLDLGADLHETE